jgi:hypothetical protein
VVEERVAARVTDRAVRCQPGESQACGRPPNFKFYRALLHIDFTLTGNPLSHVLIFCSDTVFSGRDTVSLSCHSTRNIEARHSKEQHV